MTGSPVAGPARPVLVGVPDVGGVGVGHFMRVLALAQAWNRRSGRTIVVAPPLDDALARLLAGEQITHVAVSGFDATVAAVETIAREHAVTAIAVDGYRFGTRLERAVRPAAHAILAFDDGGETGEHDVDVLTDSTPGIDAAVYRDRAPGARLLLGPRYAPLRREFEPVPGDDERPPSESETAPIVLLAGGEPLPAVRGWFEVVADGLRAAGFGVRAPGISESWRAGEVAALMRGSRLAVSTGGSTSLELCRLGIPSLLVVVAPNQAGLARRSRGGGCGPLAGSDRRHRAGGGDGGSRGARGRPVGAGGDGAPWS